MFEVQVVSDVYSHEGLIVALGVVGHGAGCVGLAMYTLSIQLRRLHRV